MSNWENDFRDSLSGAGIALPPGERIITDGQIQRYQTGVEKEATGYYSLHVFPRSNGDGVYVTGVYGHWARVPLTKWNSFKSDSLTQDERKEFYAAQKNLAQRQAEEQKRRHDDARAKVADWLSRFPKASGHIYLMLKGVEAHGDIREFTDELYNGWLCLPLRDAAGVIHSAQVISDTGDKKFVSGGRVKGCYFQISDIPGGPIIICEGYATGASIFEATGWTVICAMNSGNLAAVTADIRKLNPDRQILIAADNDQFKNPERNPGVEAAREVVKKDSRALISIPSFTPDQFPSEPTDFNDLHNLAGLDAVRKQIYASFPVLKILEARRYDPTTRPPEIRAIYSLTGKVICTPGNLTTITSGIKSGKTAVIGAAITSAVMDPEQVGNIDTLNFSSANPLKKAIIHFDSEQSEDDHWFAIDRILRRSQLTELPPWFYSYCLSGLGAKVAWQCVKEAYSIAANQCGGLHSSFIDGVADIVKDVNDAEECNDMVSQLHALSMDYQAPTINVIHFNPGSEKSRGHLGSQLERKAETNLTLDKNKDEITRIWSTKNRRAGIPKEDGPCFRYDPERGMHVTCDSPSINGGRPNEIQEIAASNIYDFIQECPDAGEGLNAIASRLVEYLAGARVDLGETSCKKIIKLLVKNGKLEKRNNRYYPGPNK